MTPSPKSRFPLPSSTGKIQRRYSSQAIGAQGLDQLRAVVDLQLRPVLSLEAGDLLDDIPTDVGQSALARVVETTYLVALFIGPPPSASLALGQC